MSQYFCIYKPYNTLSQFTKEAPHHITLRDVFPELPSDVYPVGRLDRDSEGLLILTNDNHFKTMVLLPNSKIAKTYLAQVEGDMTTEAVEGLRKGVTIKVNKKPYFTKPAIVVKLASAPELPDRDPPIRFRAAIPTSWIEITITEGKNRQIRKMCAKMGFPVLRLVRIRIGELSIIDIEPGEFKVLTQQETYEKVGISLKT
jgi:23S rRNA pseudouridine2457 synthase